MPTPDATIALASSLALAGLGAFLVAMRPRRGESVLFGAFAILWAAQVGSANLVRLVGGGASLHAPALLASFALMAPATLLLAHLAAGHLGGRAGAALRATGLAAGVASGAILLAAPHLVVESVSDGPGGRVVTVLGPLAFPLLLMPFHLAFVATCAAAYARWRQAAPGSPRARARGLFCAFALYASYVTVRHLAISLRRPGDLLLAGGQDLAPTLTYAAGGVVLLAILAHAGAGRGPRLDRPMLLAIGAPAAVAVAEALLTPDAFPPTGLWRLACVAVVAYALARHQLFGFELVLKQHAATLLAIVLLGAGVLGAVLAKALLPLGVSLVAAGGSLAARAPLSRALFPGAARTPAYVRHRRLDLYRVRLEQALARPAPEDEAELRALRRELSVSDAEHDAMENVLRAHHGIARDGDVLQGRYRLLRVLGEGGFGRAHLARDARTGGLVVVKLVHGGDGAREASLARRVESPHVARVLDQGPAPGGGFVAMEYVDGGTLAERLARQGRLSPEEVARVAEGLLAGLAAAHRAGVAHGDVKPENVLLSRDGSPKLIDFGAARATDAHATRGAAPQATMLYASPEQLRGEPATPRSDVYSAAALLHRLATGRARAAWDEADDEVLSQVPPRLRAMIARGLARDPAARYADAGAMLAALKEEVSLVAAA